jgi:hypothetical protein
MRLSREGAVGTIIEVPVPAHKFAVQFSSYFSSFSFGVVVVKMFEVFVLFFLVLFLFCSAALGNFCGSYNFLLGGFVLSSGANSVMF